MTRRSHPLQVTEMLKYFSYAEPQKMAVKAMQHVSLTLLLYN